MRKQLVVAGLATAIGVTGLAGLSVASAATDTSSANSPMSSLVQAVASKFNLKEAEVQAVFDEQRSKMQAEREAEVKAAVAQLVTDGKLTQEQADKINDKRAKLLAEREAARDSDDIKTHEERKAEMDAKRSELETWAKENGIDTEYLKYVFGGGKHGHGMGGHGMQREGSEETESGTSS